MGLPATEGRIGVLPLQVKSFEKRDVVVLFPYAVEDIGSVPVIIYHDGQNLGSKHPSDDRKRGWNFPSMYNKRPDHVAVMIDHPNEQRIAEAGSVAEANSGADQYLENITERLLPLLKSEGFGTDNVGMVGSSLYGLFNIYAMVIRPDAFRGVAAMSPSLWFSKTFFPCLRSSDSDLSGKRVILDMGDREPQYVRELNGKNQHPLLNSAERYLRRLGANVVTRIIPDAGHNEVAWGSRLPETLDMLFEHP